MACVNDREAKALNAAAHDLNMDVLAEAHDEAELDRALALETPWSASTTATCATSPCRST